MGETRKAPPPQKDMVSPKKCCPGGEGGVGLPL